jgi:hypothetical protein
LEGFGRERMDLGLMKGTDRPGGVHCGDGKEGRMREDEKRSRSGTDSKKATLTRSVSGGGKASDD